MRYLAELIVRLFAVATLAAACIGGVLLYGVAGQAIRDWQGFGASFPAGSAPVPQGVAALIGAVLAMLILAGALWALRELFWPRG